jgi:hypothetical protein
VVGSTRGFGLKTPPGVIPNGYEGEKQMTVETNNSEIPEEKNDSNASNAYEQQSPDRIADRFSRRAVETERRYDEGHDIFTK